MNDVAQLCHEATIIILTLFNEETFSLQMFILEKELKICVK